MLEVGKTVLLKLALPGILSIIPRRTIARAVHIPQGHMAAFAPVVQAEAARLAKDAGAERATPEMWTRAVEFAYQQYIEQGIVQKVTP